MRKVDCPVKSFHNGYHFADRMGQCFPDSINFSAAITKQLRLDTLKERTHSLRGCGEGPLSVGDWEGIGLFLYNSSLSQELVKIW